MAFTCAASARVTRGSETPRYCMVRRLPTVSICEGLARLHPQDRVQRHGAYLILGIMEQEE